MFKESIRELNMNQLKAHDVIDTIGIYSWFALLFLQPFTKFNALRLITLYILMACAVYGWYKKKCVFPNKSSLSPALIITLLIVLWSVFVSLIGAYSGESLNAIRKDLVVQALLLSTPFLYIRSIDDAWKVVYVILAGFFTLTILACIEILIDFYRDSALLARPKRHDSFYGGYAISAGIYIPLLFAVICSGRIQQIKWKIFCGIMLVTATALLLLYSSRTPLIVVALALSLVFVLFKRWRDFACFAAILLLGAISLKYIGGETTDRYRSLLNHETYVTNNGLSQRLSVWEGAIDVIKDRPLLGYGYGWKKLATVINVNGFSEYWKDRPDIRNYYFSPETGKASYGRVNPHNYAIQIAFEIGIIGLLLVTFFWFYVIKLSISLLKNTRSDSRNFAVAYIGLTTAYMISNITNGHWVGSLPNIVLACTGCLLVVKRLSLVQSQSSTDKS